MIEQAQQILRSVFGFEAFRGEQAAIVQHVASGQDALVLMPTGSGKSLCYQIPALLRPGVGIIISPLIALMKNQVDRLKQMGVRAAALNSSLDFQSSRNIERQLQNGELDLLYVAPERLMTDSFLSFLTQTPLALFAIDEAHCVSQWGHDFRPEYLQLQILHERFPDVPRIALTATADPNTRNEIAERLKLQQAKLFLTSFDRPNLNYRVILKENGRNQLRQFIREEHPGQSGIVYCLSRKKTEETAAWLSQQGIKALPYHAGLDNRVRDEHQDRFLYEEGLLIVATIAFGMGIDKPDVRFVAHLDLPKSMEAYFQETGRAGRDGLPADAWMAYSLGDAVALRRIIQDSDANEKRKKVELSKLNSLLGYCETTTCRRQVLLRYFGEHREQACGNCDTCVNPVPTWDGSIAAQKALSCVYRTEQRFGVGYLVDVLLGKDLPRIQQFRHHTLSTFGIGQELTSSQWHSVFRQLVAMGLLIVDVEGHGGLKLSPDSRAVLKGERKLEFRQDPPKVKKAKRIPAAAAASIDFTDPERQKIWEALRACRLKLAKAQGVPPYMIFHDTTLKEMIHVRPQRLEDLLHIPGVGKHKLDSYGADFLQVIQSFPLSDPSPVSLATPQPLTEKNYAEGLNESSEVTLQLIRQGLSPAEVAHRRCLKTGTIFTHLAQAIEQGHLNVAELLPIEEQEIRRIEDTMLELQETRPGLAPVFEAFKGKYEYGILHCVRAGLLAKGSRNNS